MQLSYLALFITVLFAKLTHQQKMELVRISDKADKEIRFLQYDEIDKAISQGVWLLYFGAHWCTNTAKFNPKFLEVQKRVVDEKLRVNVAKIECSVDHEVYCIKKYEIDGFPTLLTFIDGVLKEEYPDSDEVAPLYKYIVGLQKLAKPDAVANAPLVHAQKYLHPSSEYEGSQVIHSSEDADSTPNDTSSLLFIGILAVIALFVIVLAMRRGSGRKYQSLGRSLED